MRIGVVLLLLLLAVVSCTRAPLKDRARSLRWVRKAPLITDDLDLSTLASGLEGEIKRLQDFPNINADGFIFGTRKIARADYLLALQYVAKELSSPHNPTDALSMLQKQFDFYEVYGSNSGRWGEVLLTSYYEPQINGSLQKTPLLSEPLLRPPADLVTIAVDKFGSRFFDSPGPMRGRIVDNRPKGKLELIPYYTREQIDVEHALSGKHLELCWVDPIDAFFMHIQGSGTVMLRDGGRLRLGNADQNGHVFRPIGKFVLDIIPIETMTSQSVESYLRSLPLKKAHALMSLNPSYVFFQKLNGPPVTSLGTAVVPGRTIAADYRLFPKGALAYLQFQKPHFDSPSAIAPSRWEDTGRLVLDHDNGGAIRGGGRVDLFWGSGAEAKQAAGVIKQTARLFYLAPSEKLLSELRESELPKAIEK